MILVGTSAACLFAAGILHVQADDPRDDNSPWGLGSGAEWAGEYPKFNPMLHQAGARWLRTWPEWNVIQPRRGQWNWERADKIVADAKTNHLHPLGIWYYFAKFASADGGTRKGPIKDIQYWKDYVTASVERYKGDVKYWEIWNEFNGSFYSGRDQSEKVKDYAELVAAACDAAKKADPTVKVGMSVASTDIGFLDLAIKAGAAGHFDFICVHPYENLDAMRTGDEMGFLGMGNTLREMLAANKQDVNTPLWITEIGSEAPVKPDPKKDALQGEWFAKSYLLALSQGFQRIFWFEVRGPAAYNTGIDFSVIRADWTPRPSYYAMKTMTAVLGAEPKYLGWLSLGEGGHGFLFSGSKGDVLAAWALPGKKQNVSFPSPIHVTSLLNNETQYAAEEKLALSDAPVFICGLPDRLLGEAKANRDKPFPWNGDHAKAQTISCRLGDPNVEEGLKRIILPRPDHEGCTVPDKVDGASCRRVVSKNKDNGIIAFRADTRFVPFGVCALDITVLARRAAPDKPAEIALTYETLNGLRDFKNGIEPWTVPAGAGWQEHTWHVTDACFFNKWGAHFGIVSPGTVPDIFIKEVRVFKPAETSK